MYDQGFKKNKIKKKKKKSHLQVPPNLLPMIVKHGWRVSADSGKIHPFLPAVSQSVSQSGLVGAGLESTMTIFTPYMLYSVPLLCSA